MRKRLLSVGFPIMLLIAFSFASFAWEADFGVSTYNPAVAEAVTFAVCEPCLDGGSFSYGWDFDGDGTIDETADQGLIDHSFSAEGFYRVTLSLTDEAGMTKTHTEGILVGALPAFAKRDVLLNSDGSLFVLITVLISEGSRALGFQESIPRGFSLEILDPSGAITNINSQARELEIVWGSEFEAGGELTFSYRLHPSSSGMSGPEFSGMFSGYVRTEEGQQRFKAEICGELSL
ncbi:hypothetical protein DRJ12_03055 [Candidatus Acetothermia bacterium]|nr:MAG: hypothetical protein DRJ12_03055 [Candidatus Acetothermia bacterium]